MSSRFSPREQVRAMGEIRRENEGRKSASTFKLSGKEDTSYSNSSLIAGRDKPFQWMEIWVLTMFWPAFRHAPRCVLSMRQFRRYSDENETAWSLRFFAHLKDEASVFGGAPHSRGQTRRHILFSQILSKIRLWQGLEGVSAFFASCYLHWDPMGEDFPLVCA